MKEPERSAWQKAMGPLDDTKPKYLGEAIAEMQRDLDEAAEIIELAIGELAIGWMDEGKMDEGAYDRARAFVEKHRKKKS